MRYPSSLGLPKKFKEWRPHQLDAVLTVASSGDGVDGLNAPTGFGKSAAYMAIASLLEGRTAILVSTKPLQDRLASEFPKIVDIRGQINYECELEKPNKVGVDEAVCHFGLPCSLKGGGCTYFDAYRRAIAASTVVTNYSYWLSVHEYAEGLGGFDTLILDEAHEALDNLGNHMSTHITDWELDAFLGRSKPHDSTKEEWGSWADNQLSDLGPKLLFEMEDLRRHPQNRSLLRRVHDLRRVVKKLGGVRDIAGSVEKWVYEEERGGLSWTPVWPGRGSGAMFRGVRKVVLVSATLTPKTMDLLGVRDYRYKEYPSTFPVANRPVYHLRTGVRMRFDTDRQGLKDWLDKIDQILQFRLDRKGIIHTVSYKRRDFIMENSRYRGYMITHDRRDTGAKINAFRRMRAPAILVSPSVDTGVDFPYDQCEFNIISKIPFPDTRSPVYAARQKDDKEYGFHCAMVSLVQASGRGCRAPDDRCECVSPDTRVLTDDLRWVEAGSLCVGSRLVGFDEKGFGPGLSRRYRWSIVGKCITRKMNRVMVILEDGTELVCTPNHPWLVYGSGPGISRTILWKRSEDLRPGKDRLSRIIHPWESGGSWLEGWLAGFADGEGTLRLRQGSRNPNVVDVTLSQSAGPLAVAAEEALRELGFDFHTRTMRRQQPHHKEHLHINIRGGLQAQLRFLGQLRPHRLLGKYTASDRGEVLLKQGLCKVVEVRVLNPGPITSLQTDTKTYIAEGFGAHNTFIVDDQVDWFMRRYRRFAPAWFTDSYKPNVMVTPPPLPKMAGRGGY